MEREEVFHRSTSHTEAICPAVPKKINIFYTSKGQEDPQCVNHISSKDQMTTSSIIETDQMQLQAISPFKGLKF